MTDRHAPAEAVGEATFYVDGEPIEVRELRYNRVGFDLADGSWSGLVSRHASGRYEASCSYTFPLDSEAGRQITALIAVLRCQEREARRRRRCGRPGESRQQRRARERREVKEALRRG
jgi:hypothetical protein